MHIAALFLYNMLVDGVMWGLFYTRYPIEGPKRVPPGIMILKYNSSSSAAAVYIGNTPSNDVVHRSRKGMYRARLVRCVCIFMHIHVWHCGYIFLWWWWCDSRRTLCHDDEIVNYNARNHDDLHNIYPNIPTHQRQKSAHQYNNNLKTSCMYVRHIGFD